MRKLDTIAESSCTCSQCVDACARPCWPTPAESAALIAAGYGDRLMLDWWNGSPTGDGFDDVEILCPANPGREGGQAAQISGGLLGLFGLLSGDNPLRAGCVFLEGERCSLHGLGLKPTEGRLVLVCEGDDYNSGIHQAVAATWETDEGRAAVASWKKRGRTA